MSQQFHQPHHPTTFIDFGTADIVNTARTAQNSKGRPMSPELAALPDFPGKELPTYKEGQVLALLVDGCTFRKAGELLGIDHRTIECHAQAIFTKLHDAKALEVRPGMNRLVVLTKHVFKERSSPK